MLCCVVSCAVPPQIVDSGTTDAIIAREGANVSLSCQGTGHPEPNITWKREDGREFSPEPNQKGKAIPSLQTYIIISYFHYIIRSIYSTLTLTAKGEAVVVFLNMIM